MTETLAERAVESAQRQRDRAVTRKRAELVKRALASSSYVKDVIGESPSIKALLEGAVPWDESETGNAGYAFTIDGVKLFVEEVWHLGHVIRHRLFYGGEEVRSLAELGEMIEEAP